MTADPDINRAVFNDRAVAMQYAANNDLTQAEERIISQLPLEGTRVLDVAVGAGRTSRYLHDRAASYLGVDYSAQMISWARARHPTISFEVADARDLSRVVPRESVNFVFMLFNGLDYTEQVGRLAILTEVRRVLAPGGTFLFSSHNLHHKRVGTPPWRARPRYSSKREILSRSIDYLRHTSERRRLAPLTRMEAGYGLVNDDAHGYSLLHYYVDPTYQRLQLEATGLLLTRMYGQTGWELPAFPSTADPEMCWYYYQAIPVPDRPHPRIGMP